MNIAIVVYSETGNTQLVAEKLKNWLVLRGNAAEILRLEPSGGEKRVPQKIRFDAPPDLSPYSGVILAAPVQGFQLSPVMAAYLKELPVIPGKKAACFVTKQLASNFTGGSKAVSAMSKALAERGGTVLGSAIVHWGGKQKEQEIEAMLEEFGKLF